MEKKIWARVIPSGRIIRASVITSSQRPTPDHVEITQEQLEKGFIN